MKLDAAIKHAIDGEAIVFLGAGFSSQINPSSRNVLNSNGLKEELKKELKIIDTDVNLPIVSEQYKLLNGDEALVNFLKKIYILDKSHVSEEQKMILNMGWKNILTTNYDNIPELILENYKVHTLYDDNFQYKTGTNYIFYLNGKLNSDEKADSKIRLSQTDYHEDIFKNPEHNSLFRAIFSNNRAIIFIGYSLYDEEISRKFYENQALKEKTIFIVDESDKDKSNILNLYGTPYFVGVSGFCKEVKKIKEGYKKRSPIFHYTHFKEFERNFMPENIRDADIINLMVYGNVNKNLIKQSLDSEVEYFLERSEMSEILKRIRESFRLFVITSELGNGKSLFTNGLQVKLVEESYKVFILEDENFIDEQELFNEVENIHKENPNGCALFIDKYYNYLDLLQYINNLMINNKRILLFLTARTPKDEIYSHKIAKIFNEEKQYPINLDALNDDEIHKISNMFRTFGFTSEAIINSSLTFERYFNKKCNKEFSSIVLEVFDSEQVKGKIKDLLETFEGSQMHEFLIIASILNVINYSANFNIISVLLGNKNIYTEYNKSSFKNIFKIKDNILQLRSSVLSRYILQRNSDNQLIFETVFKAIENSHNASTEYYYKIYSELVRFYNLDLFFEKSNKREFINKIYENVKNFRGAKYNPHFWIQFSMAMMSFDDCDLDVVKSRLDYARDLADKKGQDYNFYIDSQYACYNLLLALKQEQPILACKFFRIAQDLILKINVQHSNNKRCLKALTFKGKYTAFYEQFYMDLRKPLKLECQKYAKKIKDKLENKPDNFKNKYKKEYKKAHGVIEHSLSYE